MSILSTFLLQARREDVLTLGDLLASLDPGPVELEWSWRGTLLRLLQLHLASRAPRELDGKLIREPGEHIVQDALSRAGHNPSVFSVTYSEPLFFSFGLVDPDPSGLCLALLLCIHNRSLWCYILSFVRLLLHASA
jgi:hypothetical protein